jgi:hypothetical protein
MSLTACTRGPTLQRAWAELLRLTVVALPFLQTMREPTMNIFESIKKAIFGRASTETPSRTAPTPKPAAPVTRQASGPATASQPTPAQQEVDVEAVLTRLSASNPQPLNWQTSIVDLMKLLSLDSSFENRKELANELGYTGDTNDSASMNVWLHKQVMRKLAENGGRVPQSLRD